MGTAIARLKLVLSLQIIEAFVKPYFQAVF
jgi:hypothetical protein